MLCCQECYKLYKRENLIRTRDYYGIPFRFICKDCYDLLGIESLGYDGRAYDELDAGERIEDDY